MRGPFVILRESADGGEVQALNPSYPNRSAATAAARQYRECAVERANGEAWADSYYVVNVGQPVE